MVSNNINTDLLFQIIGTIFVIIGTLLIYQGPKFLNALLVTISYITVYALGYKLVNESESAKIFFEENATQEFQNLIVYISPAVFAYFASRFIQQSLSTILIVVKIGIFSLFGYTLCSVIMSQIAESELYSDIDHPQIYTTNIKFLSVEQNVAFCVFGILSMLYAVIQKPFSSLVFITIICTVYTVSYFFDIPMLQNLYDAIIGYLLSHSQKVNISLQLFMPMIGMITNLLIGYNFFDDNMIQSGISMLFGILLSAFGLISILSGSNKDTLIPSMLCFTTILIMLGTTRTLYIPSNSAIRKLAKQTLRKLVAANKRRKQKKKGLKQGVKEHKEISAINTANKKDKDSSIKDSQDPLEYLGKQMDGLCVS